MSDSFSSSDYLYFVLVPVAEVFRSRFPEAQHHLMPFALTQNAE